MNYIKIISVVNPLDVSDRNIENVPFTGQNLSDIINEYAAGMLEVIVHVNQCRLEPVEKEKYNLALRAGDEIILVPAVRDPVSLIIAIAAQVAVAYAVHYVATQLPAFWSSPFNYMISKMGGSPDLANMDSSPAYGWLPITLQTQGTLIPRSYGTNKEYGNIIDAWRAPDGSDETLYVLIAFGEGPDYGIIADTIYINNQPPGNYEGVTTAERKGTLSQSAIFPTLKCEYQPALEVINVADDGGGAIIWKTPDKDFDYLEIALVYSGHYNHKDGGTEIQVVAIKIEISEHGADDWYTLAEEDLVCAREPKQKNYLSTGTYTGGSPVSITKGTRCDIRVTKTNAGRIWADNRKSRQLWISTVREITDTAFSYPGISQLGVSALATGPPGTNFQVSCIRKGRIVNVYNGSSWTLEWSDNPVWVIWDILTRPVISGDGDGTPYAIERYDGVNPARLTPYIDEWYAAADYFDDLISDGKGGTEKRIIFNGVFDENTTVWKAVNRVCAMARCEVLRIGRNYTILVDKPFDGNAVQLFSAGNIKPGTYRKNYPDMTGRAGELQIDYLDQDRDYQMTPMVYVDTAIGSTAAKIIEGFGITRATQAMRTICYELTKNRLLKYMPTFEADIDAIACKKGDIVLVVEPWRFGGRIVSSPAANKVVLDSEPDTSADDTLAVRMNHPDTGADTVETHTVSSVDGAEVTIADTWTVTPKKDDLYAFGPTSDILKKFRVVGITQGSKI